MNSSTHHVGLTVRDLDLTLEFYRDVFDLPVVSRFEVGDEEFATAVSVSGASVHFAHLSGGGARAELIEYDPVNTDIDEPTLNRPGTAHLGPPVESIDAAVVQLPTDTETLSEPQTTGTGTRIALARDPEGSPIELLDTRLGRFVRRVRRSKLAVE